MEKGRERRIIKTSDRDKKIPPDNNITNEMWRETKGGGRQEGGREMVRKLKIERDAFSFAYNFVSKRVYSILLSEYNRY